METRPLYFIAVRHPEAYFSKKYDGEINAVGKDRSKSLNTLCNNLREEPSKDSDNLHDGKMTLSIFSSVFQCSFQTAREISISSNSSIIGLDSLSEISPNIKDAKKAFSNIIMKYYNGEKIIIAVCHGSMPSMLIRTAYEHFVFPIDIFKIPEGISKPGCGYMLSLRDKSIEKIEV